MTIDKEISKLHEDYASIEEAQKASNVEAEQAASKRFAEDVTSTLRGISQESASVKKAEMDKLTTETFGDLKIIGESDSKNIITREKGQYREHSEQNFKDLGKAPANDVKDLLQPEAAKPAEAAQPEIPPNSDQPERPMVGGHKSAFDIATPALVSKAEAGSIHLGTDSAGQVRTACEIDGGKVVYVVRDGDTVSTMCKEYYKYATGNEPSQEELLQFVHAVALQQGVGDGNWIENLHWWKRGQFIPFVKKENLLNFIAAAKTDKTAPRKPTPEDIAQEDKHKAAITAREAELKHSFDATKSYPIQEGVQAKYEKVGEGSTATFRIKEIEMKQKEGSPLVASYEYKDGILSKIHYMRDGKKAHDDDEVDGKFDSVNLLGESVQMQDMGDSHAVMVTQHDGKGFITDDKGELVAVIDPNAAPAKEQQRSAQQTGGADERPQTSKPKKTTLHFNSYA